MIRLLAAVLIAASPALAGPFAREASRLKKKGYEVGHVISARVGRETLKVALIHKGKRTGLRVYRVTNRRAALLHLDPGFGKVIRLSSLHDEGEIPRRPDDGARIIAYRTVRKNIDQETLFVLRYADGKLSRAGSFASGKFKDLDGDGELEIVTRSRPLGLLFNVSCEEVFHSLAQNAFRTRVFGWRGGEIVPVSKKHLSFYRDRIASVEERLAGVDVRTTDRYGDYLGDSLSLYFLHEEIGEKRTGWKKFKKLFPLKRSDPKPVQRCFKKLRTELKEKLSIPEDW